MPDISARKKIGIQYALSSRIKNSMEQAYVELVATCTELLINHVEQGYNNPNKTVYNHAEVGATHMELL